MSTRTIDVNRFSSGRIEVKISKPGCNGCNSVHTLNSEKELDNLLASLDFEPVPVAVLTAEELDAFVKVETESTLGIKDFYVTGFVAEDKSTVTFHIVNDSTEDVALYRWLSPGRNGSLISKAGVTEDREYKIPSGAEDIWLRLGDETGQVLYYVELKKDEEEE